MVYVNNSHFTVIPRADWQQPEFMRDMFNWDVRFPNFKPEELCCKHCGELKVHWDALSKLQYLRSQLWKSPMRLVSAYRCPVHNKNVNGAANSLHMQGRAFDLYNKPWTGRHTASFIFYATKAGFNGFGLYTSFIHLDTGPHRTWEQGDVRLDPEDRNDPNEINPA